MSRYVVGVLAVCCLSSFGCASEAPTDAPEASEQNPILSENARRASTRELASIEVEGTTISFVAHEVDGERLLGIQETASIYAKNSPIEPLMTQGLTHLEVFKALAPGRTAPPELVEAHAKEAAAAGRADTATVKQVAFEPVKVEKSVAACNSYVYAWAPDKELLNRTQADWLTGSFAMPLKGSWSYTTAAGVLAGACNESTSPLRIHLGWHSAFDPNPAWTDSPDDIPAGSMRRYWKNGIYKVDPNNHTIYIGTSWGISGENGQSYHLKLGEWISRLH